MSKHIAIFTVSEKFFMSHRLPIALGLNKAGYKITLITKANQVDSKLKNYPFITVKDISFHPQKVNLYETLKSVIELSLFFRKNTIDIVHNYGMKPILFGTIAARLGGVHNIFNTFTGLGILFASNKRPLLTQLYEFLLTYLVFSSKYVSGIFQNKENKQIFVNKKILKKSQAHIIRGSGVDTSVYEYIPEKNGDIVVTLASRLIKSKGILEYLLAAEKVSALFPNVQFHIIGEENPNGADPLDFDTNRWKQKHFIVWSDHQDDMVSKIQSSHIIVLPTYYGEGVPKILIEAASCGRPCITTDWPGCNDIVQDNVNGLLVIPKDVDSLAQAMIKLIEDKGLRVQFGLAGRDRVCREFDEEIVLERTIDLYDFRLK